MESIKIYFSTCINILALLFLCGIVMDFLEKISIRYGASIFGKDVIIRGSAYIGTPIHELGHLIFAILFGHTIKEVVFFPTKESLAEGKLGYVSRSYNRNNYFQKFGNFFIAIGPMFSGPIAILIIFKLLLSELYNDLYLSILSIVLEGKDVNLYFASEHFENVQISEISNPIYQTVQLSGGKNYRITNESNGWICQRTKGYAYRRE
jgi:hypothetical protein